jgi:molecular chaperone DnaK (HSP70)
MHVCEHFQYPVVQVLKARAEHVLGEEVDRAVITVPSHYANEERLATMEAAMLAGITRVSLLQVRCDALLHFQSGVELQSTC